MVHNYVHSSTILMHLSGSLELECSDKIIAWEHCSSTQFNNNNNLCDAAAAACYLLNLADSCDARNARPVVTIIEPFSASEAGTCVQQMCPLHSMIAVPPQIV